MYNHQVKIIIRLMTSPTVCKHWSIGEENIKVLKLSLMVKYYSIKKMQSLVKFKILK